MFTPKLNTPGRTKSVTSHSSDNFSSGDRRSNALFTPRSKASLLSGKANNSAASNFGSKSILENETEHMLVDYGLPVPVVVTESLALKSGASATLHRHGWAWFVSGCKLVIWNYKQMPYIKAGQWFELTLPSCRVSHKACLITVFNVRQGVAPSCIAVSPDGIVRHWSNVTLDSSYTEISLADIRDDHCQEIVYLQIGSCVVGTSLGALFMITLTSSQSRLVCRPLKPAHGMLSGIGRRVSSLFFNPAPTHTSPLRRLLPGEMLTSDTQAVYVLTAEYLQKWALKQDGDRLLYQTNLEEMFAEKVAIQFWKQTPDKLPHLKKWLLDVQLMRDGLMLFAACANTDVSLEVRYVIGTVFCDEDEPPQDISLTPISHITAYEEIENWTPTYKMLLPSTTASFTYLYNSSYILCVSVSHPELPPEMVDFPNLGSGSSDDLPLFISNDGELVSVRESSYEDMSTTNIFSKTTTFQQLDTSLAANISNDKIEELSQSGSDLARFKAAFLASIQDSHSQKRAQSIVDELFPPGMPSVLEAGSSLDLLATSLSQEMIDDYPASDPRWAESLPSSIAPSSVSLILIHQLEDKLKAHELYLRFLKGVNLWSRLTVAATEDGNAMATNMLLCEHAEKLEAIKVLHDFHTEHANIVNSAIERVLTQRHSDVPSDRNLTSTDLFYREVSRVQEILDSLIICEEEFLAVEVAAHDVFNRASTVNTIIIGMLLAAIRYRQSATQTYQVNSSCVLSHPTELVPWTASAIIRSVLRRQYDVTMNRCTPNVTNSHDKGVLFQQLLELTDILLDGFRVQLDSIKLHQQKQIVVGSSETERYAVLFRKYEQERTALIRPFMRHGEFEKAASLAEKYCDFATLVELCEQLNNQDRLRRYMDQFHHKGFSDFVFKWYMEAGKRGKLMASELSSHPLLATFLDSKENQFISWLHDIQYNDFYQTHKTLLSLAEDEQKYLAKRKTLLSLSKLAALACDDMPDDIHANLQVINQEQDLLLHQEQLPQDLLEAFGMDQATMPVLSAREVVQMYISDYNPSSTEYDFKKALDLVHYFMKNEAGREDLIVEIWCRAILKDEWKHVSTVNPVESCRDTVFYRTLELVITMDSHLDDMLPTADGLFRSSLLGDIRYREGFQYLIQAILENIQRVATSSSSMSVN